MSLNTTKIFNDNTDYISISELAKSQKYSLEYLLNAASRGKLKSFKIGDDWLTTMDWFVDYQQLIKKSVQFEISNNTDYHQDNWVGFLPDHQPRLRFAPQLVVILIIFSIFSWSLSWLAFSSAGNNLALSVNNLTQKKYVVGYNFLYYTNKILAYGYDYASYITTNSINSVKLVSGSANTLGYNTANIAMIVDQHTSQYQISDEIITSKINQLAHNIRDSYQSVAGASTIRKQIYFSEWENDLELNK